MRRCPWFCPYYSTLSHGVAFLCGFDTPSLSAQGRQRRQESFNIARDIPDRALLQAQARLGDSVSPQGSITVADLLRRARPADDQPSAATRLVLRFAGDTVIPDDAQKQSLARFSAAAAGRPVVVTGQRGGFEGTSGLLGQRRAVAVAKNLADTQPDVEVRFSPETPVDTVIVSLGTPGRGPTQ